MFAGQLACEAVNFALKRLIKEERPRRIHLTGKGYGMPSSHAQFAFFWAVALALFLLARHRPRGGGAVTREVATAAAEQEQEQHQRGEAGGRGRGNGAVSPGQRSVGKQDGAHTGLQALNRTIEEYTHKPWSASERAAVSLLAFALAGLVAWSRVYLGYHTPKQVVVGCAAGALSAVAWFGATYVVRDLGLLAWALQIPLARWLRLRDLVVEEDLCQAGWEKWESLRRAKKLKKTA